MPQQCGGCVFMADGYSIEAVLGKDRGILEHFGMRFVSLDEGRCELAATVKPELINAAGLAHGGLLFAIADSACAYATGSLGTRGATITSSFSFIRPARAGMALTCVAEVINKGRRLVTLGAKVTDSAERTLIAHGTFTFMLLSE
jgi:acyl-CoA thioesterase